MARRVHILVLASASGCYTGVASDLGAASDGDTQSEGGSADDEGEAGDDGVAPVDELPAPTTRFFRLTHAQWDNTVRDLFYLSEAPGLAADFRADPKEAGYLFDNAVGLDVDGALWGAYQRAASELALLATTDETIRTAIYPVDGGDVAVRFEAFVREFGARAYRRPLDDDEVAAHMDLLAQADALYDDAEGFDAAARLAIEVMLQSPEFLYRVERSTAIDGDLIRLDGYEVAQRLSYFLWGSMPDDALFEVAGDGLGSASSIEDQARRMLDDPRARAVVADFHHVVFDGTRMGNAAPSEARFPDAPPDLGERAQRELARFVEDVVFVRDRGLVELLSSSSTFVDAELAAIYGLPGEYGSELEPVDLDPSRRRGILTQIGFLIANATSVDPDPIHRGKFVAQRIACAELPAPPDEIPPLPVPMGQTNREVIEELTEVPGSNCAGCHATLINPFGFAFENYDAIGAYRTEDNGFPVDASADVLLDGDPAPVQNALELVDLLAASPSVHRCYVRHWVELATGRPSVDADDPLLDRLGEASRAEDRSVRDLLVAIVVSQPFRTRAREELP